MSEQNPEDLIQTRLLARGIPQPRPVNLRARKRYCLIGLLAMCAVAGAITQFVPESSQIVRVFPIPFGLLGIGLTVLWCHYDSYERCYQIKLPLGVCLVLFAGIAVPCYLLLTRRWRGIVSIVLMHLFLVACISLLCLAAFIAHILTGVPFSW